VQFAPLGALPNCPFPYNAAAGGAFVVGTTTNKPLGMFSMSNAMVDFVKVNSTDVVVYERNVVSANATGDIIDLWGEGAISSAIGFEYRGEELDSRVDPFKASGDIIGFNAQESIKGSYDVYELYGEVNVPLITGETLFENLSLVGGYRKSDYSTGAGITETWKYGGEWSPFEWLTFRAVENHAVRAPTAFELFRAGDQNFPSYVDPCDKDTVALLVGPAQAARIAECTTWFSSTVPATPYNPLAFDQSNSQVQAFLFGNPNLTPEIADTLTYGVVFNPDWWPVGRLGLSVDRYEIEIDQQIGQRSIAQILNGCLAEIAGGAVPPFAPGSFCDLAPRDALSTIPGQVASVDQSLDNFTGVSTYSGIDVNLRWSWDMEEDIGLPGTFGVASLYSWVDESDGSVGLYVGSIGGVIAEHKAATSFTYDLDDWSFLLRWNYMSAVQDAVFGFERLDAYNMYDFGGRYSVTDDVEFSFGVDNIFDKQPPIWAGAIGAGQFNTDGSTYEQLGRQYRLGLRWKH
jgi:outer membrane receptor protein involved in Fe transport